VAASDAPAARGASAADPAVAARAIPYDFKHPNRVSKDQLRKLESIHDNFAGGLSSALSTIQRSVVDTDLVSVDQITYTEFISSLKSPSCTYTFKLDPLDGLCIIDFNPSLAFAIVDRLFGGRGATLETERELSGIERNVMRRIIGRVFEELEQGWTRVMEVKAEPVGFETNPQFIQIVPPGETVIVVSLQLNMPSAGGIISLCYPYVTLEGVLDKLSTQNWLDRSRSDTASHEQVHLEQFVRESDVEVQAQLGEVQMSLSDLLTLTPGMVIPLDVRVGDPAILEVAGRPKFEATVGTVGRRRAVRIEGPTTHKSE
jgi:flagellar motor switch protein FliM